MCVPIWKFAYVFVFKIFEHKLPDLVAPWLGNRRCHGNHFVPHSLGCPPRGEPPRMELM